jgi:hypothetical protein
MHHSLQEIKLFERKNKCLFNIFFRQMQCISSYRLIVCLENAAIIM